MKAIINATLVMRDHFIDDAVLLIDEGKIISFGEKRFMEVPQGVEIIDGENLWVGPGFVDIHVHAGNQVFFNDDPVYAAQQHMLHGSTTVLPTFYNSMNTDAYVKAIGTVKEAMKKPECRNIAGFYIEGPYLSPKFGCDKENSPWKGPVDSEKYMPVIEAAGDLARVWALAPEKENILDFVLDVKKKNPSAVFTVAHSEASPQEVEALIPYGLKIGTHHTNATGNRQKYPETRGVCVDEAVNYNNSIYAELICDSKGIHVDPYMLRLVRKIKGDDRIILISDSYVGNGPVPEGYDGVDDIGFDVTGEIAGSKMTLDLACRNMIKHTGASLVDVFKFASYNPATAVGFTDRGEIAVGKKADLVFVDAKMGVHKVILDGEVVK